MLKTVWHRTRGARNFPGRWKMDRIHGARRARIPGMPWFRCITNRWWSPVYQRQRYTLTEASTGFTPNVSSDTDRASALFYADTRLKRLPRSKVLAAIARINAGHYDRQRIPQRFRARSL